MKISNEVKDFIIILVLYIIPFIGSGFILEILFDAWLKKNGLKLVEYNPEPEQEEEPPKRQSIDVSL